tara:strand:+ start:21 stop:647 length:627 start_codon:yes stop_codon:yes gene_type:complete
MSDIFWIYNPFVIIDRRYIKDLWPMDNMSDSEKLNSISRLIIILTILSYLLTDSYFSILSGVVGLALIVGYYKKNEGFMSIAINDSKENDDGTIINNKEIEKLPVKPTENNPMMNVLLTDLADSPNRDEAKLSFKEDVEKEINDNVKRQIISNNGLDDRLFKNTNDEMQFDYSMRSFYTTANTQIPNAQNDFAEWCYGDMPSRKEGTI